MSKIKQQLQAQMARRGTEHKEEKRDRLIRVRSRTYDDLVGLGETILDDFDDIVSRLITDRRELKKLGVRKGETAGEFIQRLIKEHNNKERERQSGG